MTRSTFNTCQTCRHWQFSVDGKDGVRKPGWLIRHRMAACGYGEHYLAYPYRHECHNGRYDRLPEGDVAKRIEWMGRQDGQA